MPASSAPLLARAGLQLRQGLVNTARFSSEKLARLAVRLETAREKGIAIGGTISDSLRSEALGLRSEVARVARAAAALDLVCSLAQAAAEGLWAEPEVDEGRALHVEVGRHPVAERLLEAEKHDFVPNDCDMEEGRRLWPLTGPNMASKSTFLRQTDLAVLLAQIASFVPARVARIGVVDKVLSRIGASDDLAAGRSTFMVETLETAAIQTGATQHSLVNLDEVGHGISTAGGLAIAEAEA